MSEKLDTLVLHAGARNLEGAVTTPVFHSSTYSMQEGVAYRDIRYARLGNSPNHQVLNTRLSSVMGVEQAITCGSGMAAIATAIDECVPIGGTLLVASTLYGGTAGLLKRWTAAGRLRVQVFDAAGEEHVADATAADAVYVETVANPTMRPANLPFNVDLSRRLGAPLIVDNTFCSPVAVRPAELGADVVLHSATKYLNGHSDVTAGVIGGREERVRNMQTRLAYNGAMLDPGAAYLFERGLKTLGVRFRRQSETAERLVEELRAELGTDSVRYPDIVEASWLKYAGAMFAFDLPSKVDAGRFFDELKYFTYAPSLGGVESLIVRPAFASHAGLSEEERERMGVGERLVRVSVGLEEPSDLLDDLLGAIRAASEG